MRAAAGVIEGFFGRPWGHMARLAYAPFLRDHGFAFYVYAPKSDRFLRRQWREPLPDAELAQLAALAAAYRTCGLRFGIGLTPFELHTDYSPAVRDDLRRKVRQLDSIGLDILCVLFDDMHGAVPHLARLQARAVTDVAGWTTAQSLIFCPTYYSDDPMLARVFGPPPPKYLQDLGAALDPAISMFWTGELVCSQGYSDTHLDEVSGRLRRRPFIWDNHIANDGRERCAHLFLDIDATGWSLNRKRVAGLAVNPMNQPTLSRVPLARYASRFLGTPGAGSVQMIAESQLGEVLGAQVAADVDLFQNQGIAALDDAARSGLIERFARHGAEEGAAEIVGWLRGEYGFDPLCLLE